MNEMSVIQESMYGSIQAIQELNQVEGFDPRKYMRQLAGDGQTAKYYLDVVYRKLWFRLKYPNGKIVKTLKKLTDQVAIVEAKVYLDRNDPEDSFIANALAQKYLTADDQFGNKYVELAETAAVGRALADAGFGLQFADLEGEDDPNIVDAGIEHLTGAGTGETLPAGTSMGKAEEALQEADTQLPEQYDLHEYMEEPAGVQSAAPKGNPGANAVPPAMRNSQTVQGNHPKQEGAQGQGRQATVQESLTSIKRELPVDQIYKMINKEMAAAVVISAGFYKGKTLGQLALEKPQSLVWYVNDYKGPDNLLRAAAKLLLDTAQNAA